MSIYQEFLISAGSSGLNASIYKLKGFLSEEECASYISQIKEQKACIPFTDSGKFKNNKYKDISLATKFYERLQTFGLIENILRPNDWIMTGMYNPGDSFGLHTDTGLYYNESEREKTKWTLLIYLNTLEEEGGTIFYDDMWNVREIIYPKCGTAVLFDIDLWHKADELKTQQKFWIGCEIIGKF